LTRREHSPHEEAKSRAFRRLTTTSAVAARLRGAAPTWDVALALEQAATLDAYREYADQAGIVHLACHGSVGNTGRDAALLLARGPLDAGRLTSSEIEAVRLRAALVFLAACRSGSGRPTVDGTIGLSRAFLAAGASVVVSSLWNVPDAATRFLVDHFYAFYLANVDAAESLRRAMIETRDALARTEEHVHPAAWGGFFVLGRGALVADG